MKVDVQDLLGSVGAIKTLSARVGLPDGPTFVEVGDLNRFTTTLDAAMCAFQELRPGTETLVSAEVNACRKEVWIRFLQNGRREDRNGQVEESLAACFNSFRAAVKGNRGDLHYWGGNNYFDVSFPYPKVDREEFLEVKHLSWSERYRVWLERESWQSLRDRVYRFSNLAASLSERCRTCGMTTVLIPSVGICVHPWLFASRGLKVIATDSAATALSALSEPGRNPNLYSSAAYERWDNSTCASYAMIPHHDHFDGMPALEVEHVREELRQRIEFVVADWASVPVPSGSVDLVFATNAVPRESDSERVAVLEEWVRVLRPGGIVFIAQHHAGADWGVESFLLERGFVETDFLGGGVPGGPVRGGFQVRYSSG